MTNTNTSEWFNGVDRVVLDPLRFKKMLAIGEEAYTALRMKNKTIAAWDIVSAAGTTASVAKSSVVASTFFAPSGWLSLLGIGTAATPVGWVIAAGVAGGAAWWGVTQYMKSADVFHVDVIPEFINTPLDTLALGIFDLFAPLAIKIANFDGTISDAERKLMKDHFVNDWGYDDKFVDEGLHFAESRLIGNNDTRFADLVEMLALLTAENPDCNYAELNKKIIEFLKILMDAEKAGEEIKELAIDKAEQIFNKNDPGKLRNKPKRYYYITTNTARKTKERVKKRLHGLKIKKNS